MSELERDIKYIKGIGEKRAQLFKKRLGLFTLEDLVTFYPRAYEDWTMPLKICDIPLNENVCIKAKIASEIETKVTYNKKITTYSFYIYDRTGQVKVVIFGNKYLAESLETNKTYLFYGKVKWNGIYRQMDSPEIEEEGYLKLRPIYRSTEGLSSRAIERLMSNALELLGNEEFIPEYLINKYNLLPHTEAIKNIHFPENSELLQKAIQRLSFEELFLLRLGFCGLKNRNRGYTSKTVKPVSDEQILNIFPFPLTGAQKNVISQCQKDMSTNIPMNRLVQGDVGSGKTAVAAALCYSTVKSGYSAVVLAPTEILATQHYKTFCAFFEKEGFNISLLTGSLATKSKREIKEKLKNGQVDILIATHAVLTEDVILNNTALIITDEQHRFGVAQRSVLGQKAVHPHTLVMSATPIPRTMGLIIYGDLDISIIDEIPKGRKPVKSYSIDSSKRDRALGYVKKHLDQGYQGYIVCPLIEEDENNNSPLKAATNYINDLKKGPLANYSIGLLHGKMRPKEKEAVMKAFASGELQLLVSTTVIEVGVDVPNAVIMMIENSERFGLSQLHQLRGRVGRGSADSCCIFVTDSNSKTTAERLKIITSTNDGFKIAEADLKLRGPGNFLGKEQHGLPRLKIADLLSDGEILNMASSAANDLLSKDKFLSDPRHLPLKIAVNTLFKKEKNIEFN